MPRGVKKEHLPSKVCVVCHRPFTWRKKWEQVWDEVTTCSKSCNRQRRARQQQLNKQIASHKVAEDPYETIQSHLQHLNILPAADPEPTPDNHHHQHHLHSLMDSLDSSSGTESSEADDLSMRDQSSLAVEQPLDAKAARKAAKKAKKAARRAQREGRSDDPTLGQKKCDVCDKSVDLLIRCTTDASGAWRMVCGKCWHTVSGGVVDGSPDHPHYRYGGLWKNRAKRR